MAEATSQLEEATARPHYAPRHVFYAMYRSLWCMYIAAVLHCCSLGGVCFRFVSPGATKGSLFGGVGGNSSAHLSLRFAVQVQRAMHQQFTFTCKNCCRTGRGAASHRERNEGVGVGGCWKARPRRACRGLRWRLYPNAQASISAHHGHLQGMYKRFAPSLR